MSDINPFDLIERVQKLLKQQSEIFGPFNVDIIVNTQNEASTPIQDHSTSVKSSIDQNIDGTLLEDQSRDTVEALSTLELISNCNTLEELKGLCEKTDELRTDLENTNLVFGVGNPNADLMVIGEAPGMNEDLQREPFVGEAGQLLDKILKAIDFDRSNIYIANILKHRPPNNRDPKQEEKDRSLPYLLRQIELVNPKLILCVGRIAGTTLLGIDDPLKNMRQKFHSFLDRELMVTYHPAALLRNQQWKRPTWEDVQMLKARYNELVDQS